MNKAGSTARGYGYEHQQRRAVMLPYAYGRPCPLCGQTMHPTQDLDLDHSEPLSTNPNSKGDRIVHASCNRSRGSGRREMTEVDDSRAW